MNLSNLVRRVLEDPRRLRNSPRFLAEQYCRRALKLDVRASEFRAGTPFPVMGADWDNLVILDGCRYDLFREMVDPPRLRPVTSGGSESWEFMRAYFQGRTFHDTVYVTSNPHVGWLDRGTFHAVVSLLEDGWDEEAATVRPETMTERALEVFETYGDKRLVVHYMQPHFPFLGPTGEDIDIPPSQSVGDSDETMNTYNPWYRVRLNGVPRSELVNAYRENFDVAWPHVLDLLDGLDGKTVVTADHGNLIGETLFPVPVPGYGHPRGLHHPGLRRVPWVTYPSEARRDITADPPEE